MNAIIRIMTAVNRVSSGIPEVCRESIESIVSDIEESAADIVVFPSLALSSPSCGSLFRNQALLDSALDQLDLLRVATSHLPCYILIGLPIFDSSGPASVIAVLYRGERIGFLPTIDAPQELSRTSISSGILPLDTVFRCGDLRFVVLPCDPLKLPLNIGHVMDTGFDLIVVPSYEPAKAGYFDSVCDALKTTSKSFGCAVACVNGGLNDTSSPFTYRGFSAVYECGECLKAEQVLNEELILTCDLDSDIISSSKTFNNYKQPYHRIVPQTRKHGLMRPISQNPFLPSSEDERSSFLKELFYLQGHSLAARLRNTGIKKIVIGVSGGLDSTLALLVSAVVMDSLGLPRQNIIAVTLPGFGTTDRTYFNAVSLIESLGCENKDISIRKAVLGHFSDIGQNPDLHDITYENAQARERTQILMDLSNMEGGIVVGTGDLSESALGFSTFGGDQLAGYNVNICLTKGMIRELVKFIAQNELIDGVAETLEDILDTPVSPELLPTGAAGELLQKTEDILGPYELHDFFLYNLLKNGFRPSKLYYYACIAFSGKYDTRYIKEKLVLFIKKFCAGQFKRSCSPDSAAITEVNLNSTQFYIPSDMSAEALLKDIEGIEF